MPVFTGEERGVVVCDRRSLDLDGNAHLVEQDGPVHAKDAGG
jgi:hypothetical protein